MNYVNMQHNYVNMRFIHVNMQHKGPMPLTLNYAAFNELHRRNKTIEDTFASTSAKNKSNIAISLNKLMVLQKQNK